MQRDLAKASIGVCHKQQCWSAIPGDTVRADTSVQSNQTCAACHEVLGCIQDESSKLM
jgi:hypothetical protein